MQMHDSILLGPLVVDVLIAIISVIASSGFWSYILYKSQKNDGRDAMLKGLGHDRIISLGMEYLERGDWITEDEYENLVVYLYEPYAALKGNGSAERVVAEVKQRLKIVKQPPEGYHV